MEETNLLKGENNEDGLHQEGELNEDGEVDCGHMCSVVDPW